MLSVENKLLMLSVIMLSVIMLSVIMLNVVMLNVVMLSIVVPAHLGPLLGYTLGHSRSHNYTARVENTPAYSTDI